MFKKLAKQLKADRAKSSCFPMHSPMNSLKKDTKTLFLQGLSKHALDLYDRKTDVTNFTRLALSNPENESHNKIVEQLFNQEGFVDPFDENTLFSLSDNDKFLKDLGLK